MYRLFFVLLLLLCNALGHAAALKALHPTYIEEKEGVKDCSAHTSCPEDQACATPNAKSLFGEEMEGHVASIRYYILGQGARVKGDEEVDDSAGYDTQLLEGSAGKCTSTTGVKGRSLQLYDLNNNKVKRLLPGGKSPKISRFSDDHKMRILNMGCASNQCNIDGEDDDKLTKKKARGYTCKARTICRCLERGEETTRPKACCPGLYLTDNGSCQPIPLPALGSVAGTLFPKHVSETNGTYIIKDSTSHLMKLAHINMRALEYVANNVKSKFGAKKCGGDTCSFAFTDNVAFQVNIGKKISQERQKATEEFNSNLQELEKLKEKFTTFLSQYNDPKEFYRAQAEGVMYRNKKLSEGEFDLFVKSAQTSEPFNLMADEQALQIMYENKILNSLEIAYENLWGMHSQYDSYKGNGKGNDYRQFKARGLYSSPTGERAYTNFVEADFSAKTDHLYTKSRKLKRRWRARWKVEGRKKNTDNHKVIRDAAKTGATESQKFFISQLKSMSNGQEILKNVLHRKQPDTYYLLSPLYPHYRGSYDYGSFGRYYDGPFSSNFWQPRKRYSLVLENKKSRGLDKIYNQFDPDIKAYFKGEFAEKNEQGFADIGLGGSSRCLITDGALSNDKGCETYRKALELVKEASFAVFLSSSYSPVKKIKDEALKARERFIQEQTYRVAEAQAYLHVLSGLPDGYSFERASSNNEGDFNFTLKYNGHIVTNYKEHFDTLNNEDSGVKGYLRLKSYLFNRYKAQLFAGDTTQGLDEGIASGEGPNYGGPATVVEQYAQENLDTASQVLETKGLGKIGTVATAGQLGENQAKKDDFMKIAASARAKNDWFNKKKIALLNKKSDEFYKKNPKLYKRVGEPMLDLMGAAKMSMLKNVKNALSSKGAGAMGGTGPGITDLGKEEEKKKEGEKQTEGEKQLAESQKGVAPTSFDFANMAGYQESSDDGDHKQMTDLSNYELNQAIENVEDQPHLFRTDEDDTLFTKISKTYARSYNRFLSKKKRFKGEKVKKKKDKKAINNLLDGF